MRSIALAALACIGCGAPAGQVHGSVREETLEPLSVLTFQFFTQGPNATGTQSLHRTDLVVAIIGEGGGCGLLDHARPDGNPPELWLNLNTSTVADNLTDVGSEGLSTAPPSHTALFWPRGASSCGRLTSSALTFSHWSSSPSVKGSFTATFGADQLSGDFDATPCGAPPEGLASNGCF